MRITNGQQQRQLFQNLAIRSKLSRWTSSFSFESYSIGEFYRKCDFGAIWHRAHKSTILHTFSVWVVVAKLQLTNCDRQIWHETMHQIALSTGEIGCRWKLFSFQITQANVRSPNDVRMTTMYLRPSGKGHTIRLGRWHNLRASLKCPDRWRLSLSFCACTSAKTLNSVLTTHCTNIPKTLNKYTIPCSRAFVSEDVTLRHYNAIKRQRASVCNEAKLHNGNHA